MSLPAVATLASSFAAAVHVAASTIPRYKRLRHDDGTYDIVSLRSASTRSLDMRGNLRDCAWIQCGRSAESADRDRVFLAVWVCYSQRRFVCVAIRSWCRLPIFWLVVLVSCTFSVWLLWLGYTLT